MIQNNFKVAWRQVLQQKLFSFIKIAGLAIGVAVCLLITLFIRDEFSYDRHHPDADRIHRLYAQHTYQGRSEAVCHLPPPASDVLIKEFPEIAVAGRINATELFDGPGSNQLRVNGYPRSTYEEGFAYIDQEIIDIFQLSFKYGDPSTALRQPETMVISAAKAEKYFPGQDPVGRSVILNEREDMTFTITGVLDDSPVNSHLNYDFLLSLANVEFWPGEQEQWGSANYLIYFKLKDESDIGTLQSKLDLIVTKYLAPAWARDFNDDPETVSDMVKMGSTPVADIHLRAAHQHDGMTHSDIKYVNILGLAALFILLIACINFINLSTAKSANRAKEVGMRKVAGAYREQLISQFLAESLLFSLLAFVVGVVLAHFLLPYFNELAAKNLVMPWGHWQFYLLLIGTVFLVGILAGLYPAFYLSFFRPIQVFRGMISKGSKSSPLRSSLVVFQFATSIGLIIGTLVIQRQLNYILNKKLGYDKERVLLLHGAQTLEDQVLALKQELLKNPAIQMASASGYLPVDGTKRNGNTFREEGRANTTDGIPGQIWRVDHDYVSTMGMEIVQGRDFSIDMPTDSQAVIINETMAAKLELTDPLGKQINNGFESPWEVIGVVKDFHFRNLKQQIDPLCLVIGNSPSILSLKLAPGDPSGPLSSIVQTWDRFSPSQPIRYTFLDENFATMYADLDRFRQILGIASLLAVLVACMGLFGLSVFIAEQRRKEIGIRKVLGASQATLVRMLTFEFSKLVLIAMILAIPVAWYLLRNWLADFTYSIDLTADVFILAGMLTLLIAILTMSFQAVRAASANPVESLRSD